MATPDQMREYLATIDVDLTWIWSQSEVPLELQYRIAQSSINTLRKFSSLEDDRAKIRAAMAADYALDVNAAAPAGPRARTALAAIVSAWEVAREQMTRDIQVRAESKALNLRKPIGATDRTAMKKALEVRHGRRSAHELPSADYLSLKTEEVEAGEPQASQLDEITSAEDHEDHTLSTMVDLTGNIKIVKKRQKTAPPDGPESFRARLKIEAYTWIMLSMKHANISYLHGLDRETWLIYVEYFLGKKVYMMEIPTSADVNMKVTIPWQILLNYEFACRKLAFRLVREEGRTLDEALLASIRDAECKEVHFTSPIAIGGSSGKRLQGQSGDGRGQASASKDEAPWKKIRTQKGKSKGKGKGKKSKGQGKGGKIGRKKWLSYTPDGRQICYSYNGPNGCNDAECERVHICQFPGCGGAHSVRDCPKRKAQTPADE